MALKEPHEKGYEVLSAEQWRVTPADLKAAFKKPTIGGKIAALVLVWQHTRIGRAFYRYQYQRGKLSAGGISFMAIFSLTAALTVAWTVFAHLFASNPQFQETVVQALDDMLPGILQHPAGSSDGLIDPESIVIGRGNVVTGVIAFVIAVYSASRIVRYISDGIRSMFGLLAYPKNFLLVYPRYLLGLLLLLLTVVATAMLSLASTWLDALVTDLLHLKQPLSESMTFDVASFFIPFFVNLITFAAMVRFVSDVRVPTKPLWIGSGTFAVISSILQGAGGLILGSSANPLIIAAATVGTLLVWINILARAAMIICAWMANPPAVVAKVTPQEVRADVTPNYITLSDPESLNWPYHPISGDLIPAIPEEEYAERLHGEVPAGALDAQKRDHSGVIHDEGDAGLPTTENIPEERVNGKDIKVAGPPPTGKEMGPKATEWISET